LLNWDCGGFTFAGEEESKVFWLLFSKKVTASDFLQPKSKSFSCLPQNFALRFHHYQSLNQEGRFMIVTMHSALQGAAIRL
jgi:hypothetical protein